MKLIYVLFAVALISSAPAWSDGDKIDRKDAAIGGALGGAVGAVVGAELGDRNGAIIGSALGAAVGTAIATREQAPSAHPESIPVVELSVQAEGHPKGRHCPPGQAKKGRC
ncbi:MAG: YMGG-like glycine zipper-containing protein [Pseudomonadales bacterium]